MKILHVTESDIEMIFKKWQQEYNNAENKSKATPYESPNYSSDSAKYFVKLHDELFPDD